jgi:sucrose phosphorylase
MISFEGIPAIYFNSLFGKSNDEAKYVITGNNRDVNRYKWNHINITKKLSDSNSKQSIFYQSLGKLLKIKRKQKAFHPNAKRLNINLGPKLFCFKRISLDKKQSIISITNCSSVNQYPKLDKKYCKWKNIINPRIPLNKSLKLKPFETMWLSNI